MLISVIRIAALIAFLVACNQDLSPLTPPGDPEDFVRAADIVVAAQCELDAAVAANVQGLSIEKADLTLTLTVQRVEATGGGVTLGIPIVGTNLTLSRERTPRGATFREMDFRIVYDIGTAPDCPTKENPVTASGVRFIDGGLGLSEWVRESATLAAKSDAVPVAVNYAMVFEVALTSDLSPVFDRPIDDVSGSLASRDSDDREVRHRLVATALPKRPGKAPPSDKDLQIAAENFLQRTNR